MNNSPVVLFVYNRADHFFQTFEALCACPEAKETDLYIFADGAKNPASADGVNACREAVRSATADCPFRSVTVTESPENKGLALSVISGVTEVLDSHGRVIVLEDDCVAEGHFLTFMNRVLNAFENDRRIGSVAGYTPGLDYPASFKSDVFTCYRSCSWGWATWADRWQNVDWELKEIRSLFGNKDFIRRLNSAGTDRFMRLYRQVKGDGSSWSVRFGAHLVKNDMLTVYPKYSYIRNIGCDDSGVHSTGEDAATMEVDLSKAIPDPVVEFVPPDADINRLMRSHYSGGRLSEIKRFGAMALTIAREKIR